MNTGKSKWILLLLLCCSIAYGSCGTEVTTDRSAKKNEVNEKDSITSTSLVNDTPFLVKDSARHEIQKSLKQDTLVPIQDNPYRLKKNTEANFIKRHKIDAFEVPIHLTGAFAWSSEQIQKTIYKEGNRSPLLIKELYPGVLYYSKWVQHHPSSKNRSRETDKLEYYDEKGQLLKTYAVDDNNPYLQKYPDLVNHFYNAEGGMVATDDKNADRKIHFKNSTTSVHVDENTGFTQVKYTLYNSNKEGRVIDFITTFLVIDTLGNEVNRLADEELHINDTYVTPDGRFLALCTGGMEDMNGSGEEMNGHQLYGIRIYDLEGMELIYENIGKYSDGVSYGWDKKEMIFFRLKNDTNEKNQGYIFLVDPLQRIEYKRLFTNKEWKIISSKAYKEWKHKSLQQQVFNFFDFNVKKF